MTTTHEQESTMEFKRLPSQLLDSIHFEKSYGYLLSNLLADCWCVCVCVFSLFHCLFVVHFNWPPKNCYTRPMFASYAKRFIVSHDSQKYIARTQTHLAYAMCMYLEVVAGVFFILRSVPFCSKDATFIS